MRSPLPTLIHGLALALLLAGCERSRYREVAIDLEEPVASSADPARSRTAEPLRFAVPAMDPPPEVFVRHAELLRRVGARLRRPVELVQRRTYREVNDLLISGQLDAAVVGSGGLLDLQRRAPGAVEVIATPVIRGTSTSHSILIVPASGQVHSLVGLAGKRFAFTDELSLTGHLWPERRLEELGRDPDRFFGEVTYTRSHRRSVAAVAGGVVDGAAVDSVVLERALELDPDLAARIRVLERSPPFPARPVVASTRLAPADRARLTEALTSLEDSPASLEALQQVQIERFIPPPPGLYESVDRLVGGRR